MFFIIASCLISFVLANSSAVAISRPFFGINIPRSVSSVSLPTRVDQASVLERSWTHVFIIIHLFKPGEGALEGS